MKKYFYLFIIALCCGFALTACGDDDDEVYIVDENWKADNEKVIADIKANPEYKELKSESNAGSIYYKVLEPKAPKHGARDTIFYNSVVKVYYFGMSMDKTSRKIEVEFDSADLPGKDPATFSVDGVIDGFTTALHNMFPGDRWEIWIPWQLGYGVSGKKNTTTGRWEIYPYSTLKFEVEVLEVVEQ